MAACDAIVSLRSPTMGETSGSAIRALSLGKPLVVSDVGWFSELPGRRRAQGAGRTSARRTRSPPRSRRSPTRNVRATMGAAARAARRARAPARPRRRGRTRPRSRSSPAARPSRSAVLHEVAQAAAEVGIRRRRRDGAGRAAARRSGLAATRTTPVAAAARTALALVRAVPAWALARRARRRLGGDPLRARAPGGRARGSWSTSSSTRSSRRASRPAGTSSIRDHATAAYGVVYPAADLAGVGDLQRRSRTPTRRRRRSTRVLMSLAAIPAYLLARRMLSTWLRARRRRCSPSRCRRWSTRAR